MLVFCKEIFSGRKSPQLLKKCAPPPNGIAPFRPWQVLLTNMGTFICLKTLCVHVTTANDFSNRTDINRSVSIYMYILLHKYLMIWSYAAPYEKFTCSFSISELNKILKQYTKRYIIISTYCLSYCRIFCKRSREREVI